MKQHEDLLHSRYELGARLPGVALDCLGVVGEIARRRGLPPPDGWPSLRESWLQGRLDTSSGFPHGWERQPEGTGVVDLDVLLFVRRGRPGCAIVDRGRVWTAEPLIGVTCVPIHRWAIAHHELWRFAR
jgi:hypothetical protein